MRYVRNHYHSLVSKLKKDRNSAIKLSLGVALTTNQSRDYWTEVRKINHAKNNMSSVINGLSCSNSIANSFDTQYEQLYNSVPIYDNILLDVNKCCVKMNDDTDHCHSINVDDVYCAIRSLSVNKTDSVDDLYSDNFKHATDLLIQYIILIINCMISHGFVPDSFLKANVVPIPKNRRVELTDSNNYRTIAMSSIFSKILDKIIINNQSTQLKTSDYQFGFKKHSATVMCTTALTETIEYYVENVSSVFVLLIDASNAFDRVSHSTLLKIL